MNPMPTPSPMIGLSGEDKYFGAGPIQSWLGTLEFEGGLPTDSTSTRLADELDFQRAVQTVIWAEPLINNALFIRAQKMMGVKNMGGVIFNEHTPPGLEPAGGPRPGIVHGYAWINLKDTGPVVLEMPKGPLAGTIYDMWMRMSEEVGAIGPDRGRGGKYLLLPPGHQGS